MYLGIDVGSVSTNLALINKDGKVMETIYLLTEGDPVNAVRKGLQVLKLRLPSNAEIKGVGATGSARNIIGVFVNAVIVKNEIIAHAIGSLNSIPDLQTVIEIGGQDSKIIIVREGIPVDFSMNTICAAGTGSFLDHQASRLGIPIEKFGEYAQNSNKGVKIAGRCTVFAESDMIHKQQLGHSKEDIINGLCEAIVRNFLNNVARGKDLLTPIVFQGGVASNIGVVRAFERDLKTELIVPEHHNVMGAIGIALLTKEQMEKEGIYAKFDFELAKIKINVCSFECKDCPNKCEVVEILREGTIIDRTGDRCGKWAVSENNHNNVLEVSGNRRN